MTTFKRLPADDDRQHDDEQDEQDDRADDKETER